MLRGDWINLQPLDAEAGPRHVIKPFTIPALLIWFRATQTLYSESGTRLRKRQHCGAKLIPFGVAQMRAVALALNETLESA
jgi:hypothetical protein